LAEELLVVVLSEYAVLRNAGVSDDDLLAILRRPSTGRSKKSVKANASRKGEDVTMEPLLPSMASSS
jgi:hypothetical protein